jgi:hypothetical protein
MSLRVNLLYIDSFGLSKDAAMIEQLLHELSKKDKLHGTIFSKPQRFDPRQPYHDTDLQIHLEIPVYSAMSWSLTNVLLVNLEQWCPAYDAYVSSFDALIFRDPSSASCFKERFAGVQSMELPPFYVLPWCLPKKDVKLCKNNPSNGFVSFLGGSLNKANYMKEVVASWPENDLPLTIYTTREDGGKLIRNGMRKNVSVNVVKLSEEEQDNIAREYAGHIICSKGEGFGYAAIEAERIGAFAIMNQLPVFDYYYSSQVDSVAWISNQYEVERGVSLASSTNNLEKELEQAIDKFKTTSWETVQRERTSSFLGRFDRLVEEAIPLFRFVVDQIKERKPKKGLIHVPPLLDSSDCPSISVITPTYNRRKMLDIAFHNMILTDYPRKKIEWIIVEDHENSAEMASDKIIKFQATVPDIQIKYIPIQGRMSIGEKRNIGVDQASHEIILFMDDDDHYPETSFRRRVAWLTKGMKKGVAGAARICCCTMIALYDLRSGISAVNVPPHDLPLSQRISEATLTFYKSAWVERPFPKVSIAEGEEWIAGREDQVIEIPPQQIIVAFSHSANQSSRRIPPQDQKPSCFWGFPKEYLMFIHSLAGVEVEEDRSRASTSKGKR